MDLKEYQLIKRTESLYKNIQTLLIGTSLISSFSVIVLWQVKNHYQLVIWLSAMWGLIFFRSLSLLHYKKTHITKDNAQAWINKVVIASLLTGSIWGIGLLLFMSWSDPYHMIYISLVYFALIASNVSSMSYYYPVNLVFIIPYTACYVVKSLIIIFSTDIDNSIGVFTAISAALFVFVLSSFARNAQSAFNNTTRLAFENSALLNEVLEQKEAAENAVLAKNQFLAAASHDLRQPLHALGLYVSAFDSIQLSDAAKNIAFKIKKSTNSLSSLMNGLLDISRLDAASVEYRPKHIDIKHSLNMISSEYEAVALKKNSTITVNAQDDLYAYTDDFLFQRVVRNLVDNAVKFTENGAISIRAERFNVNKQEEFFSETVQVIIEDTGVGIPEEEHKKIFTEFTQLNNPERDRQKGLGLGLAIVQRLCDLMNIKLTMQSTEEEGTRFTLQLLTGKIEHASQSNNQIDKQSKENEPKTNFISLFGRNIVVVDDEVEILNAMKELLTQWGGNIIIATDIKSAINNLHLQDIEPDLILADFRLRENVNGIQVINAIRDEFNDVIPALLITGDTSPDRLKLAKSSNIPTLHKPVAPEKLNQEINKLLSQTD